MIPAAVPPTMTWLAGVMALFTLKHVVADFLLQTGWMAAGKERADGWAAPLAVHAGIHGLFTLAITLVLAPALFWLAAVDFAVHFAIDRAKSVLGRAFSVAPNSQEFWWLIGLDQMLHQLTHVAFALAVAASSAGGTVA